ncbi:sensor histidine kinase, partial [Klebsiella pneumoniae]|uniref:sensor histidine kinase n=1 Tax=Klebsiella pneumoniae TaxID=573 RepID=UPI003714BCE0
ALHRVARDLRPILIDDIDPAIALAGYVSEWGGQAGVAADFHCTDGTLDEIGEEIRNAIYRIIQEALSNIAKHAYADAVSVIVSRAGGLLRLTIEDNGCGFDTATAGKRAREQFTGGLGIAGMRERVILLGGDIEIESAPGAGTTIFVRIPVEPGKVTA